MFGFYNRLITIDLSNQNYLIDSIDDQILERVPGGKGLATILLMEKSRPGIYPFSSESVLIFATGPFCQSRLWDGSRYGVYTKSPLTGFYSESYSGGKVPEAIDAAGFDAVIVVGKAKKPTIVSVHPKGAKFCDDF